MPELPLTQHEADTIVASVPLKINGKVAWEKHAGHLKSQVTVESDSVSTALVMDLSIAIAFPGKYTFQLRQPGGVVLRRLDVRSTHTNKVHTGNTERWVHQTHKHTWRDSCGNAYAYTPSDIPDTTSTARSPSPGEHGEVFEAFCRECGVDAQSCWTDPPLGGLDSQPPLTDWAT